MAPRWQRTVTALFLVYHLAAVGAANLPGPTHFRPELLDTGTARSQLAAAAALARRLGLPLDEAGARRLTLRAAPALVAARRVLLAPFRPYYRLLGTHQPWRVFSFVDRDAGALHIDASFGGVYRPLYRPHDPDHRWASWLLDHERGRSMLGSTTAAPGYHAYAPLTSWLAARAFADFPDAEAVRVRVWRAPLPAPGAAAAPGAGAHEQERIFTRPR